MATGRVKWYSESNGFGFIEDEDGRNVYVHFTSIVSKGFKILSPGAEVEFDLRETGRGCEASNVQIKNEQSQTLS